MIDVWVLFIAFFASGDGESFTRSAPAVQGVYLSEAECQADGQAFVSEVDTNSSPEYQGFSVHSCTRTKLHGDLTGD